MQHMWGLDLDLAPGPGPSTRCQLGALQIQHRRPESGPADAARLSRTGCAITQPAVPADAFYSSPRGGRIPGAMVGRKTSHPNLAQAQGGSLSFPASQPLPEDQQHPPRRLGTPGLGALARAASGTGTGSPRGAGVSSHQGWSRAHTQWLQGPCMHQEEENSPRNFLRRRLCPEALPRPTGMQAAGAEVGQV